MSKQKKSEMPVDAATPCSAVCPKCGSLNIHRHHRAPKEEWSRNIGENRKNYETPWVSYVGYSAKALKECITHHCRCCQWKWESDCLRDTITPQRNEL